MKGKLCSATTQYRSEHALRFLRFVALTAETVVADMKNSQALFAGLECSERTFSRGRRAAKASSIRFL